MNLMTTDKIAQFVVPPKHLLRQRGFWYIIKRFSDYIAAGTILFFLSPLMITISLLLLLFQGRPILFKQRRPGHFERIFTLYKFRTMKNLYDSQGQLLPDNQRITRIGRMLRSSSLDELPQLFNVLRGELSLIGNRPLLIEYLSEMTLEQRRRCLAMPGLATYDTVGSVKSGASRYHLSWNEQLQLEVWYVDNWTFRLDIKIVFKTFIVLLKNRNSLESIGGERSSFKNNNPIEQIENINN